MWVHAWIVILCKHLSDGGWYSHYLILHSKKVSKSWPKLALKLQGKLSLWTQDWPFTKWSHDPPREFAAACIRFHLLFKPFLDVLLDYYDMNVWRIPKQILDGKVEYHNIILFFRKLNFSQILAHTIYADFQYIYLRASNWTQDSQCTNLGRGKFEAWI